MKDIKKLILFVMLVLVLAAGTVGGVSYYRHHGRSEGGSGTTISDARYNGIDVSHHQGKIDWTEVRCDTNIEFVYMKATEGSSYVDKCYEYNHKEARRNGLKVGAYHFFSSQSFATSQFNHFKKVAPPSELDLIPMLDLELDTKHCRWSRRQVQDSVQRWIDLCKKHYGKTPIIYGTQRSYNTWLAPEFNHYHLYIGRYGNNVPVVNGTGRYSIWQFSESGRIKGIGKPVDLARYRDGIELNDILL